MSWQQDAFRRIIERFKDGEDHDGSCMRTIREMIRRAADEAPDFQAVELGEFILQLAADIDRLNSEQN